MFNCGPQRLPPALFCPSPVLGRLKPNRTQTAVINHWWSQGPINAADERREKACGPPAALITPCLGIRPALLCHVCDGGTSGLTESAGNGVTSPGCLRGRQSRLQGHYATNHMALTFSECYLPLHKVLYRLATPSIHGTMDVIAAGVR